MPVSAGHSSGHSSGGHTSSHVSSHTTSSHAAAGVHESTTHPTVPVVGHVSPGPSSSTSYGESDPLQPFIGPTIFVLLFVAVGCLIVAAISDWSNE
jgi:hypothetical protein